MRLAKQDEEVPRGGLLPNGLRVQERGHHGPLDLPMVKPCPLLLDDAGFLEFPHQNRVPVLAPSLVFLDGGHIGQFTGSFGQRWARRFPPAACGCATGRSEEDVLGDQGAGVPLLRVAQGQRERVEDPARTLEPVQVRPLGIEHLGEVGMKRVTVEEARLTRVTSLLHVLVQVSDATESRQNMRPSRGFVQCRIVLEEMPPQKLRDILLFDRLYALLPLAPEDVVEVLCDLPTLLVTLAGIAGQKRHHHRDAVHLGDRLGEVLKEVLEPLSPNPMERDLLVGVHQHLIQEQEARLGTLSSRKGEKFLKKVLGGCTFPLLITSFRMQETQALRFRDLPGEHAPGLPQPAARSIGRHDFHAFLHVQLVEGEHGNARLRQGDTRVLLELPDGRQIGQAGRVAHQVVQRDERVRLAAAVGQLQLAYGLVGLAGQTEENLLDEFAQVVCRVRQAEEIGGIPVDGRLGTHVHVV